MFTIQQFAALYVLLDGDMVAGDCGIRCEQYCCRTTGIIKYLLPGEEAYFASSPPANFEFVNHSLYTGYRAREAGSCACTRALRPFCCRIFPFRPTIDVQQGCVTGLRKASGVGFNQYCWVSEPLPQWQDCAINAWQYVLNDEDNLRFYARYALFLAQARVQSQIATSALLYEVNKSLSAMAKPALWQATAQLFEMLGYPPDQWPTI